MTELEGTFLSHYHLKYLLGRGGMAEVYLAYDKERLCDVALKVVHTRQTNHLERFQREVEIMRKLTHNHILPIFDFGAYGPWHYMVMPYIKHGTLRERLRISGPLTQQEAGILLEQIGTALQYAHDHRILHRDIKSSNILLGDDNYAYLADFGLAKAWEERSDLTQTGCIMGTPEYMAPELADQPASTSNDIYALGILLYEMTTGQLPFKGKTALSVYEKHINQQPIHPSRLNSTLSRPVEQVIMCAMEKDPAKRFGTPQELVQAYTRALKALNQPYTLRLYAKTVPMLQRLRSGMHMRQAILVACIFLLVVSLLLGFLVYRHGGTIQPLTHTAIGASTQFAAPTLLRQKISITPTPQKGTSSVPVKQPPRHGHRHGGRKGD